MQKRHDDLLTTRLENILNNGVAHISWEELYRWYDTKKIAAGTLRDLTERWTEFTKNKDGPLMCVDSGHGYYLFPEKTIKPLFMEKA